MKKIVVSAPGKIHLSGEHAVVHGKPAVVVSTSKRLYVTLSEESGKRKAEKILSEVRSKDRFIDEIVKVVEKKYKTRFENLTLNINSDIPVGAGMGSSAALAVALVGALTQILKKPWNATEINELAFQAEKYKHINSSGSDPSIVAHGGLLWYRKELDFLKTFWLLSFKIPKSFAKFLLINTGRVESTGDMVMRVANLRKQNETTFILLISQIEETTRQMVQAIHDENEAKFRKLISENEALLEKLQVVSVSTKKLIREIEKAGGAAKISGAGGLKNGSGIVIALHNQPQTLFKIAEKYHYSAFQTTLGGEGVKIEKVVS